MKSFVVEGCNNEKEYRIFVRYMLAYSDSFSMTVFMYKADEKLKRSAKRILDSLNPFLLYSENTTHLPSMETRDSMHIYRLNVYRSCMQVIPILEKVISLWEWDYPQYPMDLCFFRSGYAWFVSSAHEESAFLYTNDMGNINDLRDLGLTLIEGKDVSNDSLFKWDRGRFPAPPDPAQLNP